MDSYLKNQIEYIVCCISDFADRFGIEKAYAYDYLNRYQGLNFIYKHYDALHTLSIDDAIDDLENICKRNGGGLSR